LSTAMAIEGLMDIDSVDSDGFTLIMDDVESASFVGYMAFGAKVTYDVYLQIWNKATDTVTTTIGSCLGVTAAGDDVQCLVSGVSEQTLTSDQVVRVRVVHSGSTGTVSIDYDDADSTGDSRVTIPPFGIPEFDGAIMPVVGTLLVAVFFGRRAKSKTRNLRPTHPDGAGGTSCS
jgi:hypothetical protein